MLKSDRMKRVDIVVLDDSIDKVLQALASFGNFELIEKTEKTIETPNELYDAVTKELRRLNYLIKVLEVQERAAPMIAFKELKDDRVKVVPSEIRKILEHTKKELDPIAESAKVANKLQLLTEKRAVLKTELLGLELFKKARVDPGMLGGGKFATILLGTIKTTEIDLLKKELAKTPHLLSIEKLDKEDCIAGLVYFNEDAPAVEKLLTYFEFKRAARGEHTYEQAKKALAEAESGIAAYEKELERLRKQHGFNLLATREIIENCDQLLKTTSRLSKGKMTYHLQGWVPEKEMSALKRSLDRISKSYLMNETAPSHHEDVPVKLNNKSAFKAFESVTKMFGLPRYNELDPTLIMAFTFPLFFGLMFGDVGHGAIILAIGFIISRDKSGSGLKDLGTILTFCGIAAMFFGVMYGSVFGIEGTIIHAQWMNPAEDPNTFLIYAIMVGVLQMSLGVILSAVNFVLERHYKHLLVPVGKLAVFWPGVYLVFNFGTRFGAWASSPMLMITFAGMLALLLSAVVEIEGGFSGKKIVMSLFKGLFEVYETLMGFLANTISYARIFALVLVHAGLSMAIFQIAALVDGLLFDIPKVLVLIVGTLGIVGLEGIMVFLHTMRLHYYEWFNKFFSASGRDFAPLEIRHEYTSLKND